MPFKEPNRRDSWPPTILRLQDDDENLSAEDIDDNPFAYFITSPPPEDDDKDFEYFEYLSAGIEGEEICKTPVREVSPSSVQRTPLATEDDSYLGRGFSVPLSLKDFSLAHEKKKYEKTAQSQMIQSTPSLRGRNTVRLTPTRTARGRGRPRSLSAQRPHAWREPSPDVWSIPEEKEEADVDDVPPLSLDDREDVTQAKEEQPPTIIEPPPKAKKRVHWGILPRRDA